MALGRGKAIWPRILSSRITLIFVLLLCVLLISSVYERYTIEREMAERRMSAEAEREQLLLRKNDLERKVEYLSAEYGVEAELRKHFDVAQAGEQVVIIVDGATDDQAAIAVQSVQEPSERHTLWSWLKPW